MLRIASLRALVTLGTATVLITEVLSPWSAIDRIHLLLAWCVALVSIGFVLQKTWAPVRIPRPSLFVAAAVAAIGVIGGLIAWTALLSPPNSADTMSYHLPRVLYWMQNGSVRFFPTSYLNLIMMQPATEYMMLHTYLLSGSDAFSNVFQFLGYCGSVIGVSSIAQSLGLDGKGQAIAAIFCATLPNAILQASGAKNDAVLACWLVCTIAFALCWIGTRSRIDLAFSALAAGLAFGTKGTAYLFLPPMLAAVIPGRMWLRAGVGLAVGILLINGPQFVRNIDLSGSPLGFDSAHGDGLFRWRNEHLGWRATTSNILRNVSEQLGGRSAKWNEGAYAAVLGIHEKLGLNPQDPDTTWRWSEFKPPVNANHEANANNRWHLLIFLVATAVAAWRRERTWLLYCGAIFASFLLFCFYLKWQPYFSRVELPLFVFMAPAAAMAISRIPWVLIQAVICVLLVSNARLAVTGNWTRPLTGPKNLRSTPRNEFYFSDVGQWNNRESYLTAVDRTAASRCTLVGLDITQNHVTYPYQILLRQKNPAVRFAETAVQNASKKYANPSAPIPCAVLCLDCAGLAEKTEAYSALGPPETIGRFLLFLRRNP